MRIVVMPGVLRPPTDCRLLAAAIAERGMARERSVLDVFAGSGVLAIAAAETGAHQAVAVDISRIAVLNARLNAALSGVRLEVLRGNMSEPVGQRRFDLIVANPPYVPSASDLLPSHGPARAWDAGPDGRAFLDRLCDEAAGHLNPGGNLAIVQSSISGERETLDRMARSGLEVEVLGRRRGPLGPIAAARVEALEARGVLRAGEREEELLVIAGTLAGRGQPPAGSPAAKVMA
jgi:release factor glutamine methyltransferase